MKVRYVFNPFTGMLETLIIPPSKGDFVKAILIEKDEGAETPIILFDEDSILYEDDGYIG